MRQLATNHIGWVVQWLDESGWRNVTMPISSQYDATCMLDFLQELNPDVEYRTYEEVDDSPK